MNLDFLSLSLIHLFFEQTMNFRYLQCTQFYFKCTQIYRMKKKYLVGVISRMFEQMNSLRLRLRVPDDPLLLLLQLDPEPELEPELDPPIL